MFDNLNSLDRLKASTLLMKLWDDPIDVNILYQELEKSFSVLKGINYRKVSLLCFLTAKKEFRDIIALQLNSKEKDFYLEAGPGQFYTKKDYGITWVIDQFNLESLVTVIPNF